MVDGTGSVILGIVRKHVKWTKNGPALFDHSYITQDCGAVV